MPDVEQELARFGRWLDTEIETHASADLHPWVAPAAPSGRRRWMVATAAAAVVLAVLLAATLLRPSREPAISPGPSTTAPGTTTTVTTTVPSSTTASTSRPSTTVAASTVTAASVAPVEPSSTDAPTTATTRARATTAATDPPTTPAPTIPTATTPAPSVVTTAPPPPTEAPPTPATTSVVATCHSPVAQAVGRNFLYYRPCADGLRYSSAVPQAGWTASVSAKGPPSITVTFTNGTTSLTCTLSLDGDGIIATSGDC